MKPTPITDAAVQFVMQQLKEQPTICQDHPFYVMDVMKAESRKIERQLSDALEREKALEDALQVAVDSELGAKWIWPDSAKETWMKNARELLSGDEPTYTDCPIHGRHEGDCPRC